jgi:hypothetical protein
MVEYRISLVLKDWMHTHKTCTLHGFPSWVVLHQRLVRIGYAHWRNSGTISIAFHLDNSLQGAPQQSANTHQRILSEVLLRVALLFKHTSDPVSSTFHAMSTELDYRAATDFGT